MSLNMSDFITNISLSVNESVVSRIDYYETYNAAEKEQSLTYKWVAYVIGALIVISNIVVVISSGLILKKGNDVINILINIINRQTYTNSMILVLLLFYFKDKML